MFGSLSTGATNLLAWVIKMSWHLKNMSLRFDFTEDILEVMIVFNQIILVAGHFCFSRFLTQLNNLCEWTILKNSLLSFWVELLNFKQIVYIQYNILTFFIATQDTVPIIEFLLHRGGTEHNFDKYCLFFLLSLFICLLSLLLAWPAFHKTRKHYEIILIIL